MKPVGISRRDFIMLAGAGFGLGLAGVGAYVVRPESEAPFVIPEVTDVIYRAPEIDATTTPPPTATPVPKPPPDLFGNLIMPFVNDARRLREARARSDPEGSRRADPALNRERVNFLLFGYGESHEPPLTERSFIGSHTIASYNVATRVFDFVSLTHDIRAPEIERFQRKRGENAKQAVRMDKAYSVGGFPLQRQVLENATGLAIDYQVAFDDVVIKDVVDDVLGPIEVDLPYELDTNAFYLAGKKHPGGKFPKGSQKFDGLKVIQFIKTVPVEKAPTKQTEHNARKHMVFEALLRSFDDKSHNPLVWAKALAFLNGEMGKGRLAYDFDVKPLLIDTISAVANSLGQSVFQGRPSGSGGLMPGTGAKVYIVDRAHGDGGVRWVTGAPEAVTKRDIATGVYPDLATEVPLNADPYADDLVTKYWASVRFLVKVLLSPASDEDL